MANLFLDTNILIDIFEQRKPINLLALSFYDLRYSPLSIHIYLYLYKLKTPLPELALIMQKLRIKAVNFSAEITEKALNGPTLDFEDNVQLQSANEAGCDYFLTNDKKMWGKKFFQGMKVIKELPQ